MVHSVSLADAQDEASDIMTIKAKRDFFMTLLLINKISPVDSGLPENPSVEAESLVIQLLSVPSSVTDLLQLATIKYAIPLGVCELL
jgi:hypothetical protein